MTGNIIQKDTYIWFICVEKGVPILQHSNCPSTVHNKFPMLKINCLWQEVTCCIYCAERCQRLHLNGVLALPERVTGQSPIELLAFSPLRSTEKKPKLVFVKNLFFLVGERQFHSGDNLLRLGILAVTTILRSGLF